jgi:hypothetical protein
MSRKDTYLEAREKTLVVVATELAQAQMATVQGVRGVQPSGEVEVQ